MWSMRHDKNTLDPSKQMKDIFRHVWLIKQQLYKKISDCSLKKIDFKVDKDAKWAGLAH